VTAVTEEQIDRFFADAIPIIGAPEGKKRRKAKRPAAAAEGKRRGGRKATFEQIADWLQQIPNDGMPNWDGWNRIGMALWDATFQIQRLGEGGQLFHEWSAKNPAYDCATTDERWQHYKTSPPSTVGAHTLAHLAYEARMSDDGSQLGDEDNLPLIRVTAGRLPSVVTRAERALIAGKFDVFQRGTRLVRPTFVETPGSRGEATIAASIVPFTLPGMVDVLSQAARFEAFNRKEEEWCRCDPPERAAKILLERFGSWTVAALSGVITTPTMRPDGSILFTHGYDKATRLFHMADKTLQLSPEVFAPTREAAERALEDLLQLIAEFPFVEKAPK
jgi:putative DNA primase/helicase